MASNGKNDGYDVMIQLMASNGINIGSYPFMASNGMNMD